MFAAEKSQEGSSRPLQTRVRPTSRIKLLNPTLTKDLINHKHFTVSRPVKIILETAAAHEENNEPEIRKVERPRKPRKENLSRFNNPITIEDEMAWTSDASKSKENRLMQQTSNSRVLASLINNKKRSLEDTLETTEDGTIVRRKFIILGEAADDSAMNSLNAAANETVKRLMGSSPPNELVSCPECGKKVKLGSLKAHCRTHRGEKRFNCDICHSRFTRRGDVVRHKRLVHSSATKESRCADCFRLFPNEEQLRLHSENLHNRADLTCKACSLAFGRREYLDNHMKYVHPELKGAHGSADQQASAEPSPPPSKLTNVPSILRRHGSVRRPPAAVVKRSQQTTDDGYSSTAVNTKTGKIPLGGNCLKKLSGSSDGSSSVKSEDADFGQPSIEVVPGVSETHARLAEHGGIQIVDTLGNVGQIVKVGDDTFMIVDVDGEGKGEEEDAAAVLKKEPKELAEEDDTSPDAVQTLIDAVQELIQTHETAEAAAGVVHRTEEERAAAPQLPPPDDDLDEDTVALVVEEDGTERVLSQQELESFGLTHLLVGGHQEEEEAKECTDNKELVAEEYLIVDGAELDEQEQQAAHYVVIADDGLVQL